MKAKELMVGDYIMFNGSPYIMEEISDKGWVHILNINNKARVALSSDYILDFIEGIPLTPEILEKSGFIKALVVSDTPPFDKDEEGNMHFSLNEEFWGWWQPNNTFLIPANGLGWLEFKYVHELQHALKLCEISKEIIL